MFSSFYQRFVGKIVKSKMTKYVGVQTQFIAALGDPKASKGSGASSWGIWRVDPGPRGVHITEWELLKTMGGLAPSGWIFDNTDWWLEEHGLMMEKPEFPLPAGKYVVTGGRETQAILTVAENGDDWELSDGAVLHDVTHLPCRSARYQPLSEAGSPGKKKPWTQAIIDAGFPKVEEERLTPLVKYLEFCLKQVVANNELGGIMELLNGDFLMPAPGGDPIRNPDVLPTGRNMHALDRAAIPTTAAIDVSENVVRKLLEKLKAENDGMYPESIAFTLWGTDNIKTYGESLAQVLALAGVRPVPDSLGRVNKVELIPLEELGRPRIDVVVSCSGVFRDLFINQMNLMDRGIKMAAEADEPIEMNFVRKHALEQAAELNVSVREAAARVFSNAAGSYSANVGLA